MKPHKWAKEIKAWADGQVIQSQWQWAQKDSPAAEWFDNHKPDFDDAAYAYRIKPQPKEPQYLYVYKEPKSDTIGVKPQVFITTEKGLYFGSEPIGKIKLEQDDVDSV